MSSPLAQMVQLQAQIYIALRVWSPHFSLSLPLLLHSHHHPLSLSPSLSQISVSRSTSRGSPEGRRRPHRGAPGGPEPRRGCGNPTAARSGGGGSPERGRSAAAAAVRAGPRRYGAWWPAEGVVDCGLISKNFRGLFEKYSERGEWTADCISDKFEDFYAK